jgi:protein-tyrosine-phosphatase
LTDEPRKLRVLTVCTHNRTRSVMSAALLEALLGEQLGPDVVAVKSCGFGPADLPPIPDAVDAMLRRGLDVSQHRSSSTNVTLVDGADLILTAERDHVVRIAGLSPAAFRRTFTLPEFLASAADASAADAHDGDWNGAQDGPVDSNRDSDRDSDQNDGGDQDSDRDSDQGQRSER